MVLNAIFNNISVLIKITVDEFCSRFITYPLKLHSLQIFNLYKTSLCNQVSDGQGREAKVTIWGHPGNDVSGMVSRSEKVAGTCEKVFYQNIDIEYYINPHAK